jgi:hypothetical protein
MFEPSAPLLSSTESAGRIHNEQHSNLLCGFEGQDGNEVGTSAASETPSASPDGFRFPPAAALRNQRSSSLLATAAVAASEQCRATSAAPSSTARSSLLLQSATACSSVASVEPAKAFSLLNELDVDSFLDELHQ